MQTNKKRPAKSIYNKEWSATASKVKTMMSKLGRECFLWGLDHRFSNSNIPNLLSMTVQQPVLD